MGKLQSQRLRDLIANKWYSYFGADKKMFIFKIDERIILPKIERAERVHSYLTSTELEEWHNFVVFDTIVLYDETINKKNVEPIFTKPLFVGYIACEAYLEYKQGKCDIKDIDQWAWMI